MRYESIIWDWNGTLLDDLEVSLEVANEILEQYRLPGLTIPQYRDIFDFPVSLYWQRAGLDLSTVNFETVSDLFGSAFFGRIHRAPVFDRALSILEEVKSHGTLQFILSNTQQSTLEDMLEAKRVDHFFADIRGIQDSLARGKTQAGLQLVADHSIQRSRTILIGDTLHDFEVATALEVDCLLISTGHHSHERLLASGANVVSSLEEAISKL
jgi:phosphoglycolate phosphatase